MIDNDLLVRRSDLFEAFAALRAVGYLPLYPYSLDSAVQSEWQFPLLCRIGGMVHVAELHWRPFSYLYTYDEDFIWNHTETDAAGFLVLDEPMTAVQLAAHMASHRFAEERVLRDFKAAWGRLDAFQRPKAFETAQILGLSPTLDYVLLLAHDQKSRNKSMRARLAFRASSSVRKTQNSQLDYLGRIIAMFLAPPLNVLRTLWATLFPPLDIVAWKMGTKSRLLAALMLPLRPIAPLLRIFGFRRTGSAVTDGRD